MLKYSATLSSAKAYAEAGKLDAWIHLYLNSDGHNIPFSDGLKKFDRHYISPALFPVSLFTRCTGPEKGMKYRHDPEWWESRVKETEKRVQETTATRHMRTWASKRLGQSSGSRRTPSWKTLWRNTVNM